jgi:hypothetical protein
VTDLCRSRPWRETGRPAQGWYRFFDRRQNFSSTTVYRFYAVGEGGLRALY